MYTQIKNGQKGDKYMIDIKTLTTPTAMETLVTIMGMRNPYDSWSKSDSEIEYVNGEFQFSIGNSDWDLMKRLIKAGTEHRKFLRMINVVADIKAPLYWWKEMDTYKIGTVCNSCSTMHTITKKKFTLDDFSTDKIKTLSSDVIMAATVSRLNELRDIYLNGDSEHAIKCKETWYEIIQLLPSSYNQKRTMMINYETLLNIYGQRRSHKLDEWIKFCEWIENLPLLHDIIISEYRTCEPD